MLYLSSFSQSEQVKPHHSYPSICDILSLNIRNNLKEMKDLLKALMTFTQAWGDIIRYVPVPKNEEYT